MSLKSDGTSSYWIDDLSPFIMRFSDSLGIRYYGLAYVLAFIIAALLLHLFSRMPQREYPTMSASRQLKPKPTLRICAAALLVVWLAVVGVGSTYCLGEDSHAETGHIEKVATTSGQSHDSDSHDDSLCVSMHSLRPTTANPTLIKPDFSPAFALDFLSTAQIVDVGRRKQALAARRLTVNLYSRPNCGLMRRSEVSLRPFFFKLNPSRDIMEKQPLQAHLS